MVKRFKRGFVEHRFSKRWQGGMAKIDKKNCIWELLARKGELSTALLGGGERKFR